MFIEVYSVGYMYQNYPAYNADSWIPTRELDSQDVTEDSTVSQKLIRDIFKEALPRASKHLPAQRAKGE